MPGPRTVSLFFELAEIQGAAEAVRLLLLDLQGAPWDSPARRRVDALVAGAGTLSLVICRLRLLRFAIEGVVDPGLLLGGHNVVVTQSEGADQRDVRLRPWRRTREQTAAPRPSKVPRAGHKTRPRGTKVVDRG